MGIEVGLLDSVKNVILKGESSSFVERFPSIAEWYATMFDYLRLVCTELSGRGSAFAF